MSSASVQLYGGIPSLFIDGEPQVEMAYMTYFDKDGMFEDFYRAGYRISCLCVYFGDQIINPANWCKPFAPGIFGTTGKADFSHVERSVTNLLRQAHAASSRKTENDASLCGEGSHRLRLRRIEPPARSVCCVPSGSAGRSPETIFR